jgi:hypothetical protein
VHKYSRWPWWRGKVGNTRRQYEYDYDYAFDAKLTGRLQMGACAGLRTMNECLETVWRSNG